MIRQFRYALQADFIEFPAGKVDPGENVLETAKRELREEIGQTALQWRHLATIHPVIGYSNEVIEIYLAKGLATASQYLDDEEFLDVFEVTFEEAMEWLKQGKITDVKTAIGLFWYQQILSSNW
jgi:ADP-ribose pyrophosphatase